MLIAERDASVVVFMLREAARSSEHPSKSHPDAPPPTRNLQ